MKKTLIALSALILIVALSSCLSVPTKLTVTYKVDWTDSSSIPNGVHSWYITAAVDSDIEFDGNNLPTTFVYNKKLIPDTTLYSQSSFTVTVSPGESVVLYVYEDTNDNGKLDSEDLIDSYDHWYFDYDPEHIVKFYSHF